MLAGGVLGAVAAFHVVDHRMVPRRWHLVTHALAGSAALAAGRGLGLDDDELGLSVDRVRDGAVLGAAVASVTGLVVGAAAAVPGGRALFDDERVRTASGRRVAWWALVEIPVGTALYEEALFRGVALGLARRHLPDAAAVALTSALFGAWHILPALADREANPATAARHPAVAVAGTVVATTAAGAGFAVLRLRSGSLLAPVLAHTASNAVPLLVAGGLQARRRRRAPDADR